jgi:WD40 repeat protein
MLAFQGPRQEVQCVAFVPGKDGGWLAAGYWGYLVLWPLAGGDAVQFLVGPDEQLFGTSGLEELAVSPDGKWIFGRWFRGIRLWRQERGRWLDRGLTEFTASGICFRGHDLFFVTGESRSRGEWVYRIARGRPNVFRGYKTLRTHPTRPHPQGQVTHGSGIIDLSPDRRLLATSAHEKAVQLWVERSGKHLATLAEQGIVEALAWAPDGETLALNAGTTVRLYDVKTLAERVAWKVKYSYHPRLAFSPDGRLLATTDSSTGVHLWDAATGARKATLRAGRERRVPVAFAPDGLTIAAGGGNGSVALWDV